MLAACLAINDICFADSFSALAGPPFNPPSLPISDAALDTRFLLNFFFFDFLNANTCAGVKLLLIT
jgi:hypothetical protein